MAKTNQKEIQEKKRIKREKERERRQKIRDDPVKRELQRQKEREKYLKQKEKGVKKNIAQLKPREQRIQRKKWKQNSKNYREMKMKAKEIVRVLEENTPPQSEAEEVIVVRDRHEIGRMIANRNKVKRDREKKRLMEKYENKIHKLSVRLEKYKQRCNRLAKKNTKKPKTIQKLQTPPSYLLSAEKRVDHYIENMRNRPEKIEQVKRKLVLGEVMKDQLSESYQEIKNTKSKQFFKKIINGRIVKKKKLSTDFAKLFKYRFSKKAPKDYRKQFLLELKNKIQLFLEEDTSSRLCPGKKDYVTKNNVQHQKRFLINTLKNLFREFLKKNPNIKVSYAFFCRWRPFWIVPMKINDRETCKCITHANVDLFAQGLHKIGIIRQKNGSEIMKDICCDLKNEQCLFRNCIQCNHKKIEYEVINNNETIGYYQWVYIKEKYFDKKTKTNKISSKIGKKIIEKSAKVAIEVFEKKIKLFMEHEARINHQYVAIRNLKDKLTPKEILIHCDFSENYNVKYAEETQAFHFGGSRRQISLHTVVVYSNANGLTTESFCSLSVSLQHDASAIWAHLLPVLMEYCNKNTELHTFHFLSDSPATQYRNKYMFSFLALQVRTFFPKIRYITWNYQEAGHGKGAPDGIGGVCKRTADRVVSLGRDIPDIETLIHILLENCPGVKILKIDVAEITKMTELLQKHNAKTFVGTMKVHQIKTTVGTGLLYMRRLSCFECEDTCKHYGLGTLNYQDQVVSCLDTESSCDSSDDDSEFNLPLSFFKGQSVEYYNKIYGEPSGEHQNKEKNNPDAIDVLFSDKQIVVGTYVLVQFSGQKKNATNYRYLGVCQTDMDPNDGEVEVTFLKICDSVDHQSDNTQQLFKLDEEDVSYVKENQIINVFSPPDIILKGNRIFYKFKDVIDIFEKS